MFFFIFSFILYLLNYIYFPSNSVFYNDDGSSFCLEISNFKSEILNTDYEYVYPESCDQERYYSAFSDPKKLITTEHPYQTRPIFVGFIYLINLLVGLLTGSNEIFSLQISTFLGQILILSFGSSIILSTFSKFSNLRLSEKTIVPFFSFI